ncbi:MAG: hypothetical protein KAV87_54205 [Desulfobacteraceae bacterium]|nr:hypothetical protein [Desulfobacteraceae bacterium]
MIETKKKKATPQALQIYVGEDKVSVAKTVNTQVMMLSWPTPEKYIMQRKGRGNLLLDYVETNYVIGMLNAIFLFNWDTEILEQIIDKEENQIAMKVRLTVRFADGKEISKDAWGGSDIKRLKDSGKMVDFADDLKSAESDGIKKAASMLGICWDVYAGLTSSGKKGRKKTKAKEETNGFTQAPSPPDRENQFRTIPIKIGSKTYLHTKYEVLDRFKAAKSKLGKELYYKILGENGYEKSDQIPKEDIQKLYDAMIEAYEAMKISIPKKKEEKVKPEPEKKIEPKLEGFAEEGVTKEEKEAEEQSLGFSTDEMEKEGGAEFPPLEEKKEEKVDTEMPLQREIMSLTGLEATLVDKHGFTPDQIIGRLKEMFGEDNVTKLTRKQVLEGRKHFEDVINQLNKAKEKE